MSVRLAFVQTHARFTKAFFIFFAKDQNHITYLLSLYDLQAKRTVFLPLWLSKIIITVLHFLPFFRINSKVLQDIFSQMHNSIRLNQSSVENLINMISKNNKILVRYHLIVIHDKLRSGIPFSQAVSELLKGENAMFASLIHEAESGGQLEMTLNECSRSLLMQSQSSFNLFRILIPFLAIIATSIFVAHLVAKEYITIRIQLLNNFNQETTSLMEFFKMIYGSDSLMPAVIKISLGVLFGTVSFTLWQRSRFYPKFLNLLALKMPLWGHRKKKLMAISLIKMLTLCRLSNLNIYHSLYQVQHFTSDKVIKDRIAKCITSMDHGTPPLSSMKSMKIIPLSLYYLLDRLTHSGNQHDLVSINELCNNEYVQIMSATNEFYRSLAIAIVFLVNLFTFYAFADTYYYFGLWT